MDEHLPEREWRLEIDHRERSARLLELVQMSDQASENELIQVPGLGTKKAAAIRAVLE